MLKYGIMLMIGCLIMAYSSPCLAEDNALTKLGRGLNNTLTGWIEVPDHIYNVSQEENIFMGLTYGSVKGTAHCVARTSAGAIESGTFIFPDYDKPLMEPKYKF